MRKHLLSLLLVLLFGVSQAQPCIQNSNSLNFGGSASVTLTSNTNLQLTTAITVEAWVYPTSWAFDPANGTIVCHHSWTSGSEMGYVLRAGGSGQLSFNIGGLDPQGVPTSWQQVVSSTNVLSLNTWSHVAGTFDGTNLKIFVNGIQVGILPFTGTIIPPTAFMMSIGKLSDTGLTPSRYWNGRIDEVRIWNRPLVAAELQSNMNSHIDAAAQTGLVGYWRFNEGTGNTVNDLSISANNGTTSGATFVTAVPFNQTAATPVIIPNGNLLTSTPAVTYQWNLNGVPINGATSQSWQAVAIGTYTVTVTDSLTCSATSGPYFVATVGVNELSDGSILDVKQSAANIDVNLRNSSGIQNVTLVDLNGRQVYKTDAGGSDHLSISKESLAKGIFILLVNTKTSTGKVKILIN